MKTTKTHRGLFFSISIYAAWCAVTSYTVTSYAATKAEERPERSDEYDLFYKIDSDNFVIRWAFQELCDHIFDPRKVWPTSTKQGGATFDPKNVKPGDMIFVRDAPYFFKMVGRKIDVPFFILTHGEYLETFQDSYFKYANYSNVLAWFTIHPNKKQHEKSFLYHLV